MDEPIRDYYGIHECKICGALETTDVSPQSTIRMYADAQLCRDCYHKKCKYCGKGMADCKCSLEKKRESVRSKERPAVSQGAQPSPSFPQQTLPPRGVPSAPGGSIPPRGAPSAPGRGSPPRGAPPAIGGGRPSLGTPPVPVGGPSKQERPQEVPVPPPHYSMPGPPKGPGQVPDPRIQELARQAREAQERDGRGRPGSGPAPVDRLSGIG